MLLVLQILTIVETGSKGTVKDNAEAKASVCRGNYRNLCSNAQAVNYKKKYADYDAALSGMQRFCAYQERSHAEVRSKLLDMGVYGDTLEQVMGTLIEENFLNEERFACAFVRGKCHIKKWGRLRIENELKIRKISNYCIQKALKEIDHDLYIANLKQLIQKKNQTIVGEEDAFKKNHKLYQVALQKGYEPELIGMVLKECFAS